MVPETAGLKALYSNSAVRKGPLASLWAATTELMIMMEIAPGGRRFALLRFVLAAREDFTCTNVC